MHRRDCQRDFESPLVLRQIDRFEGFNVVTAADTGQQFVVFGLPFLGDEEMDGLPNKFSRAVSEKALGFGITRPDPPPEDPS